MSEAVKKCTTMGGSIAVATQFLDHEPSGNYPFFSQAPRKSGCGKLQNRLCSKTGSAGAGFIGSVEWWGARKADVAFLAYKDAWLKRGSGQGRRSRRISGSKRSAEALTASRVKGIACSISDLATFCRQVILKGHVAERGLGRAQFSLGKWITLLAK